MRMGGNFKMRRPGNFDVRNSGNFNMRNTGNFDANTHEKALQRQRIAYMENCIGASVVSLFGLKATVRCVDLAEILRQFATRMDLAQADITAATDAEVIVNAFIADLQQAK